MRYPTIKELGMANNEVDKVVVANTTPNSIAMIVEDGVARRRAVEYIMDVPQIGW